MNTELHQLKPRTYLARFFLLNDSKLLITHPCNWCVIRVYDLTWRHLSRYDGDGGRAGISIVVVGPVEHAHVVTPLTGQVAVLAGGRAREALLQTGQAGEHRRQARSAAYKTVCQLIRYVIISAYACVCVCVGMHISM